MLPHPSIWIYIYFYKHTHFAYLDSTLKDFFFGCYTIDWFAYFAAFITYDCMKVVTTPFQVLNYPRKWSTLECWLFVVDERMQLLVVNQVFFLSRKHEKKTPLTLKIQSFESWKCFDFLVVPFFCPVPHPTSRKKDCDIHRHSSTRSKKKSPTDETICFQRS